MTIFLFNYNANGGNAQGESRKYVWRCVKGRGAELRPGGDGIDGICAREPV